MLTTTTVHQRDGSCFGELTLWHKRQTRIHRWKLCIQ